MTAPTAVQVDPALFAAFDVTLTLDDASVIRDVTLGASDQPLDEARSWIGMAWADTVTPESRSKLRTMLAEAADGASRRRQVNHLSKFGADIPVSYAVVRVAGDRPTFIAAGLDLRAMSVMQQRLVEAQQSLERDYWRMRSMETRYRMLFHASSEAVLILDAASHKIVDANPAAARILGSHEKKLIGRPFPIDVTADSARDVADHFAAVRAQGRADEIVITMQESGATYVLSASLARLDNTSFLLVRMLSAHGGEAARPALDPWAENRIVDALPDGFLLADASGRVVSANQAFLDMAQMASGEQVRGQELSHWLGRPGAECARLFETIQDHGVVRLFHTELRGEFGATLEVEVSGVSVVDGEPVAAALVVRDIGRRLATGVQGARDLSQAVEQLTALVGRVSLKRLVRDTTDLVERHFIEAALEMTDNNRTSAADVLGLSRQSLYVKLRQYELGSPTKT